MGVVFLQLEDLKPPRHRLRDYLGEMGELKESIKAHGLLQPLLVRKVGSHYEIIAGHRRFQSLHELGVKEAECKVVDATDQMAFELALVENIERKSLDPIEEAKAFKAYTDSLGYGSIEQLSKMLKKSPSFVVRRLELLKNEDVVPLIQTGKLTVSQAEELIGLDNEKASELADIAIKADLTTTQIGVAKRYMKGGLEAEQAVATVLQFPSLMPKESQHYNPIKVSREGIGLTLTQALHDIDNHILILPEGEERAQYTQTVRAPLHELTNIAIRLRKRYEKKND
jgi:ParB family chromosome partitioning protein